MTYYGGRELADAFRGVRKHTIQIAEDIPESKYDFRAAPDCRTIAQTLVHVALSPGFQYHIQSNNIDNMQKVNFSELSQKFGAEEARPRTKSDIVAMLTDEGEKFASFLDTLSESFLAERVTMPPGSDPSTKSRFEMILSTKEHEMHHRGQLMVLQRMIGIVPHLTRQHQTAHAQPAQR